MSRYFRLVLCGMPTNSTQDIVEYHFTEYHKKNFPSLSRPEAWEQFIAHLTLKPFKVEQAEISAGIVDGKYDGGIDSFHIVLNLTESVTLSTQGIRTTRPPKGVESAVPLDVVIAQSKSDGKWDHTAIWKLRETLDAILNGSNTLTKLYETPLNQNVIDQVDALRRIERKVITLNPRRSIAVYLASNAPEGALNTHMKRSLRDLEAAVQARMPHGTRIIVKALGAESLLELIQQEGNFDGILTFTKSPIREAKGSSQAFLGLITIKKYLDFLRREKSKVLRDEFFGVNVRQFAGDRNPVNSAIKSTLSADSLAAFWWMNNGITILADSATEPVNDTWLLKNPQIVNGLQTSHVLHSADIAGLITRKRLNETVLVRIVTEKDSAIRESIVTGTNNQTNVSSLQLFANDDVQRRIEAYLLTKGWFYERRRWQFRGSNVSASKIKSISELGQAVIATRLLQPDTARARPASLLNKKAGYSKVFAEEVPEALYAKSLELVETVENYLRSDQGKAVSDNFTNDRYYLVSGYIVSHLKVKDQTTFRLDARISQLDSKPTATTLQEIHKKLYKLISDPNDVKRVDALFKGSELKTKFFTSLGMTKFLVPAAEKTKTTSGR